MFRRDRGSRGGGVFILVRNLYIANRVQEWETDCEILWIKLQLAGSVPLHIAAYYKPSESDTKSFEEFKRSIAMVSTVKAHTWVLGDFNFPKFCWADNIPTIPPDCKYTHQYEEFIDLLNEFSLTQLVTQPTRFENILDLFLIDNPTLVKSVDIKPGIADHYAVLSEVYIKPQVSKQKPRLMFMYKKGDWEGLENHMLLFQKSLLASHEGKSINLLWEEFEGALHSGIEKHPSLDLPWHFVVFHGICQIFYRFHRKSSNLPWIP